MDHRSGGAAQPARQLALGRADEIQAAIQGGDGLGSPQPLEQSGGRFDQAATLLDQHGNQGGGQQAHDRQQGAHGDGDRRRPGQPARLEEAHRRVEGQGEEQGNQHPLDDSARAAKDQHSAAISRTCSPTVQTVRALTCERLGDGGAVGCREGFDCSRASMPRNHSTLCPWSNLRRTVVGAISRSRRSGTIGRDPGRGDHDGTVRRFCHRRSRFRDWPAGDHSFKDGG